MKTKVTMLFAALSGTVFADMGSIPFKKGVLISEPAQDAIIAWNGKEELLYLQTTLGASEPVKVLEVMPLPSRPTVVAGDEAVFKRCATLLPRVAVDDTAGGGADPFGGAPEPVGRVVERKLIGAHDIRVVELLGVKEFTGWITREIARDGDAVTVPDPLLNVIGQYAEDGYRWFVFDVVDLAKEHSKKTPLQIRFATDKLYYPMRITRTEKGRTTVSLSILTNVLFNKEDCVGIPRSSIKMGARPIAISGEGIRWIDPPIFDLLGRPKEAHLRSWSITGDIDSFDKDLLIRNPASPGKSGHAMEGKGGGGIPAPKSNK